jgi:hypothetical protein
VLGLGLASSDELSAMMMVTALAWAEALVTESRLSLGKLLELAMLLA